MFIFLMKETILRNFLHWLTFYLVSSKCFCCRIIYKTGFISLIAVLYSSQGTVFFIKCCFSESRLLEKQLLENFHYVFGTHDLFQDIMI